MKKIFFLLFIWGAVIACGQNKKVYMNDFEKFVDGVKQSAEQYGEEDWEKADQQLADFKEGYRKYSAELTDDEKNEIIKLESTYAVLKMKKLGNEIKEGANEAIDKVKDTAKEVVKKSKKAIEGAKEGWQE